MLEILDGRMPIQANEPIMASRISGAGRNASIASLLPEGKRRLLLPGSHDKLDTLAGIFAIGDIALPPGDPLPQVAQPAIQGGSHVAAQIAAQTLGPEFKQWLNDPQKLLQLIAAAEGAAPKTS